ncbi:anti-sigma factor [Thalassorhabdus alkalitolerans]|uniref:Anti-sigma factor n=1 Tax=Thalassorhabdus alkalitolerans TaxID=2282697 RepID=A0ABW0YTR1_9BACI
MACDHYHDRVLKSYFNEELDAKERASFYEHLKKCSTCHSHYHETTKTIAFIQSASHLEAPGSFTASVMEQLPKKRKRAAWKKWAYNHPVAAASAIFLLLMSSSVFSIWNDQSGQEISVQGSGNVHINKENGMVVIPEDEVVEGDLIVQNGSVEVHGEVLGDLTVINGEPYLASAGEVAGEIEEVDQVLEWIWYHAKRLTGDILSGNEE